MAEEIIIDEYSLINHIATGSSTQVWEVIDKAGGNKHFAMKVMLPEALQDSDQKNVLKHEAKVAQRFDHPQLLRCYKLVMNKKHGYMIMDYFRAPNLKTQMQTELVSLQIRIGRLIEQLCHVLGYLHDQGWVHRDIKPDNILFNKGSELKLIDFSLTQKAAGAVTKMLGGKGKVIQGTRTYISPEAILKAAPSPQSDIYSLGVTLFEVLAGEPPFRGSSPDELLKKHLTTAATAPSFFNTNITPEMDRFILRMLCKKPKDRHKNCHEILAEFRNLKPFKEDVAERDRRLRAEADERYKLTLDKSSRLDSRADHVQQELVKTDAAFAKEYEIKKKKEAEFKAISAKEVALKAAKMEAKEKEKESKAAPAKSAAPKPPATSAPPAPAAPHGYAPSPYGYPGYAPSPYQPAPYPGAAYPGAGYPGAAYPGPGYPGGGYPPPGYAAAGYPQQPYPSQMPQQPPMYQQPGMPQPPVPQQPMMPYPSAQPPSAPYPGSVPGAPAGIPYGASPYGSQIRMPSGVSQPGAPQRGGVPQPAQHPNPAQQPGPASQQALVNQQQMLQQMMSQQAAAAQQQPKQPARPNPSAPQPNKDLPLMDKLPPVK